MPATEPDAVQQEIRIAAPPETVFPFFTDPEKMLRWKEIEAALDPRPGGMYRVNITGKDVARGKYVEVPPPSRVVFTWGWEEEGNPVPLGSSTVEVTLTPDGDGTLVRPTHRGLPPDARAPHGEGWAHFLPRLATVAAGGDPGPDPWATSAMRESGPTR